MGLQTATLSIDQLNCSPGVLNFQLSKINHLTWLGFRTGYWNVSYQQQSSGFQSPRWSFSIKVCLFLSQHNSLFLACSCIVWTLFDNCYCSHTKVNSMNMFPSLSRPATLQINHKILNRDTLLLLKKAQFMKRTIIWNMNRKKLL